MSTTDEKFSNYYRKVTVVLDLDMTLVKSVPTEVFLESDLYKVLKPTQYAHINVRDLTHPDGVKLTTIFRPHAKEFVKYCFQMFENVVIWTAGTEAYGRTIAKHLIPENAYSDEYVWTREDCVPLETGALAKPLKEIARSFVHHDSDKILHSSILLIDDNPVIVDETLDDAVIKIPPFFGGYNEENAATNEFMRKYWDAEMKMQPLLYLQNYINGDEFGSYADHCGEDERYHLGLVIAEYPPTFE
jgi:TFIIF-interacting CTD phosphatase-like protein